MGTIFETLKSIGVASDDTKSLFASRTRDNADIQVWQDSQSQVIYIDGFYVGEKEYETGEYREQEIRGQHAELSGGDYESVADAARRLSDYQQFYVGKDICDVGCGDGAFLKGAQKLASRVSGVELQDAYLTQLQDKGIECEQSILNYQTSFQTVFMFHSLEHFEDPLQILQNIRLKMTRDQSTLIIEVPHANDFLISTLKCEEFVEFTLWSQHLILHTRESLKRLLNKAGFSNVIVEGKQRYGISNHLTWLNEKRGGGHKSPLSSFETENLKLAYEGALQKIDATDTLVAIAEI